MHSPPDPASPGPSPCVLVTHEYAPFRGGVATYVQEIAWASAHAGWPVEVWTVDGGRRAKDGQAVLSSDSASPFPVVRFGSSGRLTPGGLLTLAWGLCRRRQTLRGRRVILLSVGAQMAFFLLGALGVVPAARVTCFFHGSEILRFQRNPFWRRLARRFYARAAGFAVNSFHVEHLLRASVLIPMNAPIAVAPCACPSRLLRAAAGPSVRPPDEHVWRVLTVARLHPRKGQLEVARALALLPVAQRERVVYQMVGVGEAAYREQVAAVCREGNVRCEFLGGVPDESLGAVYARATLYAQASRTLAQSVEGFGISFLEASLYGCPVAAFRSGGVEEAVRDGETGVLVPEGDLPALAAAMGGLLAEPATRSRLGAAGQIFARGFHWEASARTLVGPS